jgi:hypothetical protein
VADAKARRRWLHDIGRKWLSGWATERPTLAGGASLPHRHDADVFGYILAGHLIVQVAGHDPITLGPGQTFTENPDDIHLQSANASATEPAKFLVFIVKDKDKPVSRPVVLPPTAHSSTAPRP